MAAKLIILVACIALSQGAMVRRDAPKNDIMADMMHNAEEIGKIFSNQMTEFAKSKDMQDFQKVLQDGANTVEKQLEAFGNSLLSAIKDVNGKTKDLMVQSQKNIERTTAELRKAHPDVEKNADVLREKMQNAVQTVMKESQKVAVHFSENISQTNEKLAPKIKAAFEDFVKDAQEVGKKLQEAAAKPK